MKSLKSPNLLQYLTLVFAVLYSALLFGGGIKPVSQLQHLQTVEDIAVVSLYVLFLVGFFLSWYNGLVTGVLFLVWNALMWILELFFATGGGGFGIVLGVPLLVLGVFYILMEYKHTTPAPSAGQQWKLALRILVCTYTILYLIYVVSGFTSAHKADLLSWPGSIFILMLGVYAIGFLLSWKWELIAGVFFVIWYLCLLIPALRPLSYWLGPLTFFGVPVLLQGFLYFIYYSKFHQDHRSHDIHLA